MRKSRYTQQLVDWDTMLIEDDFTEDLDTVKWTSTLTDTGTAAVGDARRGILTLTPSDASVVLNDEVYVGSANELFLFATNSEIVGRCRLSFVETTSGVYNAFFGFANAIAADTIVDTAGGMRASGCVVAIHKISGETVWRATARNSSTTTTTASTNTAVMTSGQFQLLQIEITDWDGVSMQVAYQVSDSGTAEGLAPLKDSNGRPISHTVPIASATEMSIGFGAKLGAATNNDLLLVDKVYGHQLR